MEAKKTPKADLQNKRAIFMEIGLAASLLLMIILFGMSQKEVTVKKMDVQQEIIEFEMVEITREEQKPPEVRQQQVQVTSDIINIVRDDKKIETSLTFADFSQDVDFVFEPVGGKAEETVDGDEPFVIVENMPMFNGSEDPIVFRNWVQSKISYPAIAQENGVQGRVTLQFVVERDGSVTNVVVLVSPDRSLSEEAARVVSSSPKWTPGKQRGNPVRVKYTLPVDFKLQ